MGHGEPAAGGGIAWSGLGVERPQIGLVSNVRDYTRCSHHRHLLCSGGTVTRIGAGVLTALPVSCAVKGVGMCVRWTACLVAWTGAVRWLDGTA